MKTVNPFQFFAPFRSFVPRIIAGIAVSALAVSVCAADSVVFHTDIDGTPRSAAVEEVEIEGVSYVSAVSITEQLGGSVTVLPTRARLEVAGSTAWIQADDNRVNAFRIFSLSRPVVRADEDYLIGTADVSTFFENGFRVTLARETADMETRPVETIPAEPVEKPELPAARAPAPPSSTVEVIVIDPGHGGFDAGVEGAGGLSEKALVLDIAMRVKSALEGRISQRIVLTREDDLALNESQRAVIVQNASADVLVALHAGSSLSPDVRGAVVLYESGNTRVHGRRMNDREEARRLGGLIAESLRNASAIPLRGFDTIETRSMAHPGISGVMIELGCLTNAEDEAALRDDTTRSAIVDAIAAGVLQFLGVASESAGNTG